MELFNEISKYESNQSAKNYNLLRETLETFLKLISPLAPHFSEEIWEKLGHKESIHKEKWPEYDENKTIKNIVEIPIQINGKIRKKIMINPKASQEEVKTMINNIPTIAELIKQNGIKKEFYVPGKIYSIVLGEKN